MGKLLLRFLSYWTLAQNGAGVPVWASSRGIGLLGAALGGALGEQLAALSLASVIWPESDMTTTVAVLLFGRE
jgi:hypothetical protein